MACKTVFLYLNTIYFEILLALCYSSKNKCYDVFKWSHNSTLCSMDLWIGEELEIVHPDHIDTSVLMQQPNHRLTNIWNGKVKYLVLTITLIFLFSLTFTIQMGSINTDNWFAIFESINAWTERPKLIMQKSGVIYISGYGMIEHPGIRILIIICQQQLLQPLVRLFPISKYLLNHLLFRISYLIIRRLMVIIFRLHLRSKMLNWGSVILT